MFELFVPLLLMSRLASYTVAILSNTHEAISDGMVRSSAGIRRDA